MTTRNKSTYWPGITPENLAKVDDYTNRWAELHVGQRYLDTKPLEWTRGYQQAISDVRRFIAEHAAK